MLSCVSVVQFPPVFSDIPECYAAFILIHYILDIFVCVCVYACVHVSLALPPNG